MAEENRKEAGESVDTYEMKQYAKTLGIHEDKPLTYEEYLVEKEKIKTELFEDQKEIQEELWKRISEIRTDKQKEEDNIIEEMSAAELKEILAAIEHQRWSDYMEYFLKKLHRMQDGCYIIDAGYADALWKLIRAKYENLGEAQKQADRDEVERYWRVIETWLQQTGMG